MKLLINYPSKVIVIVILLCGSTMMVPYLAGSLPQFSHPRLVSITQFNSNRFINIIEILNHNEIIITLEKPELPVHYRQMTAVGEYWCRVTS